jgi:hypothetical protein
VSKESAATGDLVKNFLGLEASHDLFDINCLWLNHLLETKYKKEFLQVSPLEWGKWHLKSILNALPDKLPLSSEPTSLPEFETAEKIEVTPFHAFPLKVYLTWREILSGGVKIPKSFNKELSHSREYIFTDADENKNYTVFYYPQQGYFLGLKEFFAINGIPQGTSMTLERKGPVHFHFWLKKSKKKISVAKLIYDPDQDLFSDAGEAATLALPNKIIYLERDTLLKMIGLYRERADRNLRDLLILVFKNFGPPSAGHSLHFLRAYHLVDILKRTSQEDVEYTLLNSFEFTKSDKKKGIFYFQEAAALKEEILPGALPTLMEEIPEEVPAEEIPMHEIQAQEVLEDITIEPGIAEIEEKPKAEKPAAKKEKAFKKKKVRAEGEKVPRARKSERRVIEEKIEEEESEEEALIAVKGQEEEELEEVKAAAEAPAEAPPVASPEAAAEAVAEAKKEAPKKDEENKGDEAAGAFGSLLAEKLKAALTKKRQEDQKK